jgi:hypothetical protein
MISHLQKLAATHEGDSGMLREEDPGQQREGPGFSSCWWLQTISNICGSPKILLRMPFCPIRLFRRALTICPQRLTQMPKATKAKKVQATFLEAAASLTPPSLTAQPQGKNVALQMNGFLSITALGPYQVDVNMAAFPDPKGPVVAEGVTSFTVPPLTFLNTPLTLSVLQYQPAKGNYRLECDISGTDANGNEQDLGHNEIRYTV